MTRILKTIIMLSFLAFIACGSSEKSKSGDSLQESEAAINWVRFDEGLQTAADSGKHVLAYFWRDG